MAQLDNTVEVTNEVKPVVTDVKKVDVKAQAAETRVEHYVMQYAVEGQPLSQYAEEPLADYSTEAVRKGNKRGYLHVGGGSHGQVDSRLGYLFDLTACDGLAIDLSLKGFNGRTTNGGPEGLTAWKSRDYHNRSALRYSHRFDEGLEVYAKGALENRLFNYAGRGTTTDKQHDVLGNVALGITPYRVEQLTVTAEAGLDFFRQRYLTTLADKLNETVFRANADVAYQLDDRQGVGLGVGFVGSGYGNDELDGITRFRFTPHYIYKDEAMQLRAGLFVSTKGHVAPDVAWTWHLTPVGDVYAEVRGHEDDNVLRRLSDLHPCFVLGVPEGSKAKLEADFHQVKACVGYRFNLQNGLSGHVNGGFDLSEQTPDKDEVVLSEHGLLYPWLTFEKTRYFFLNADVVYAYRDVVKVDVRNQLNWEDGKVADGRWTSGSYQTPAFETRWTMDVKMAQGLYGGLNCEFAAYRTPEGMEYRRPNTLNVGADLRYTLPLAEPLTVFVKGDNLLNQKYDRFLGYRHTGTSFLAGFALSF